MDPGAKIALTWFAALGALVLLIYLLVRFREKKRTAALGAVAQSLGFMFLGDQGPDTALPQQISENTVLFENGWGQKYKNIMRGTFASLDTSIFDYSYITGRGRGARTWQQTVFAFSHDLSLPAFDLKPENFINRMSDSFTHSDIDFDSHPEFSRRYFLRSPRRERIKELFIPELLTYLEGLPPEPKWHIEGNGRTLFIYLFNRRVAAEDISGFAQNTSSIATSFFRYCGAKPKA